MAAIIEVGNLVKHYGEVKAVDGVSFSVESGEVFALLGPNGAGKSTTVEILEGHRRRDSGDVKVLGGRPGFGRAGLSRSDRDSSAVRRDRRGADRRRGG